MDHEKHWFHGRHIPAVIRLFGLEKTKGSHILASVMVWVHKSNLMHISLSQSLNIVKGDVAHLMDFPRTYISYHPKEAYGRKSIFECVWGNRILSTTRNWKTNTQVRIGPRAGRKGVSALLITFVLEQYSINYHKLYSIWKLKHSRLMFWACFWNQYTREERVNINAEGPAI